ncbi:YheV family putative metal-binding protein [Vibrio sp. SM6]|uniref:YheV family putative metal-binding protein n=1 Tax=Vibrio agarilyticus TaxID=2726741 RepID=A0A7X8TTR9_9VIBR|nr:YheV family putative zinc ribbon protein [Vibrio agarilyticus]NLS14661.1 YheV family putative metal-binding protein [Vibrio agarilyticus]
MVSIKKRFIAEARCPSCQQQDVLRWWIASNIEWVECVECDFVQQRLPQSVEKSGHQEQTMIGIFRPD